MPKTLYLNPWLQHWGTAVGDVPVRRSCGEKGITALNEFHTAKPLNPNEKTQIPKPDKKTKLNP